MSDEQPTTPDGTQPATPGPHLSICLVGESGTGKTRFAGTMPTPIGILDADDTGRLSLYQHPATRVLIEQGLLFTVPLKRGATWQELRKALGVFNKAAKEGKMRTFVVDPFTGVSAILFNYVMECNSKEPWETIKKAEMAGVYGGMKNIYRYVVDTMCGFPCHKLFICHEEEIQDTFMVAGTERIGPVLIGRFRKQFGANFDEVWRMETKMLKVAETTYFIRALRSGPEYELFKTRLNLPTSDLPADFGEIIRLWVERGGDVETARVWGVE